LGRYVYNGLDEALYGADPAGSQPDARSFDVIVIGGGSIGPIFAEHLVVADKTHSHCVLVLEGPAVGTGTRAELALRCRAGRGVPRSLFVI
jgi:hypothetical protein